MLDSFEILTTSGVVLWSKTYVDVSPSIINSLVKDVFIEDNRAVGSQASRSSSAYQKDGYTLKWTGAKDLGLIFVAVYQSLLQISWIDKLLQNIKALFTELYKEQIKRPESTRFECNFDPYFDRQVQELERTQGDHGRTAAVEISDITPPSSASRESDQEDSRNADTTPVNGPAPSITPDPSRPNSPAIHSLLNPKTRPGSRGSRRARKAAHLAATTGFNSFSSGDESPARKSKAKKLRKWGPDGMVDEDDGQVLDYSAPTGESESALPAMEAVDEQAWGSRTRDGKYMLKDIGEEMQAILSAANSNKDQKAPSSGIIGSRLGAIGGLFRNVVGGKKLTKEDLAGPLSGMEDHLIKKNVAREAAIRLRESVENDLVGMTTASFTSIESTLKSAMTRSLTHMLTPTNPLDLLREISTAQSAQRPYVMSIIGVNGVGKSTNLSKIAFFLLQNRLRVLVVAADTFRSGAVEQLRVHVRNLQELTRMQKAGRVDLYERGYGSDAASIARDAVAAASQPPPAGENGATAFDVVLIDTAGRRHNDARLMSNLSTFAAAAKPDKILMVGEALVGSDSVSQARNFDAALRPAGRRLDGFIISKCDTVGDMVGALVSVVHATGRPVLFLGVGQHYGDLRALTGVEGVVELLMRD